MYLVFGNSLSSFRERDYEAYRSSFVSFIFQDYHLIDELTVLENITLFNSDDVDTELLNSTLRTVGMEEYAHHAPHKLSGGQKQRIAIAGILAMKPSVILFDESTSMLDPLGRAEVVSIMERLNREEEITVVHITHYMDEAARADRVIVMNDGRIAWDGTPREVFKNVDQLRDLGLEAPQGVELLHELALAGMPHSGNPLTEQECVEALLEMLGGAKNV